MEEEQEYTHDSRGKINVSEPDHAIQSGVKDTRVAHQSSQSSIDIIHGHSSTVQDPESNDFLRSDENVELEEVEGPLSSNPATPGNENGQNASCSVEPRLEDSVSLRRLATRASQQNQGVLKRFWRRHVSVAVPFKYCRDHLALERTYLGYVRTSVALSMIGIVIAQLYPQTPPGKQEPGGLNFVKLAKPMSASFVAASLLVTIFGAWRFGRQQGAMVRGRIVTGSWEVWTTGILVLLVCLDLLIASIMFHANSNFAVADGGSLDNIDCRTRSAVDMMSLSPAIIHS